MQEIYNMFKKIKNLFKITPLLFIYWMKNDFEGLLFSLNLI